MGAGLILACLHLDRLTSGKNESFRTKLFLAATISLIGGFFVSNRITYLLVFSSSAKLPGLYAHYSGLSFLPGLLAGALICLLLLCAMRLPIIHSMNLLTTPVIVAHGMGRLGCFFAGCCYGKATSSPLGVIFPDGSLPALANGPNVPIHAVQLYEAGFLFGLFFCLNRLIDLKIRTSLYLISYGLFRFLLEFLRGDQRGEIFGFESFSPSQLIGIVLVGSGIILALYQILAAKKRPTPHSSEAIFFTSPPQSERLKFQAQTSKSSRQ